MVERKYKRSLYEELKILEELKNDVCDLTSRFEVSGIPNLVDSERIGLDCYNQQKKLFEFYSDNKYLKMDFSGEKPLKDSFLELVADKKGFFSKKSKRENYNKEVKTFGKIVPIGAFRGKGPLDFLNLSWEIPLGFGLLSYLGGFFHNSLFLLGSIYVGGGICVLGLCSLYIKDKTNLLKKINYVSLMEENIYGKR